MADIPAPVPDRSPSRRGRPLSAASRDIALRTAAHVLDLRGWRGFSVDEVARTAHVGKATIYKHWPDGFALAVHAYGRLLTATVPTIATGRPAADLIDQVRRLAEFYSSPRGLVVAQLLGAAVGDPDRSRAVRELFFAERRTATLELLAQARAEGQLSSPVDDEVIIDMLFGPIVFRLFNGMRPLAGDQAAQAARVTWAALTI